MTENEGMTKEQAEAWWERVHEAMGGNVPKEEWVPKFVDEAYQAMDNAVNYAEGMEGYSPESLDAIKTARAVVGELFATVPQLSAWADAQEAKREQEMRDAGGVYEESVGEWHFPKAERHDPNVCPVCVALSTEP